MVNDKQVDVLIALVAVAHWPTLVGMFLLAEEVIDGIDNGDTALRLRLLEHLAQPLMDARHKSCSAKDADVALVETVIDLFRKVVP